MNIKTYTMLFSLTLLGACELEHDPVAAAEFYERAEGEWTTVIQVGEGDAAVFATDAYTFTEGAQTIEVVAYFDPELTIPFLAYEAELTVEAIARAEAIEDGYAINLSTDHATMTALVDDPSLFAAFGLDDCGLVFNEPVDVSGSACGVPLFRDASCVEMDLYQVNAAGTEFRAGVTTDKCVERPMEIAPQLYVRPTDG